MIKESCNLSHTKPHQTKSGSKTLHDYPIQKKKISIIFRDTDDQRILNSDWMRGTTGHIQTKVVVSDATLPW